MKKKLTSKQRYGDGYFHIVQYDLPKTVFFPLKNDILFFNFNMEYTDFLLNHKEMNQILQILANNSYKKVEITLQISYLEKQTNEINPLGQVRRYPTINELQNYEGYLLSTRFNKHIVYHTSKEGFVKDPNFDYKDYLDKDICISTIWLQIEHENPDLYKLL